MSGLPAQIRVAIAAFACLLACVMPAVALADGTTGGAGPDDPELQPHGTATLLPNGQAVAPSDAPPPVAALIHAGNKLPTLPYDHRGRQRPASSGPGPP